MQAGMRAVVSEVMPVQSVRMAWPEPPVDLAPAAPLAARRWALAQPLAAGLLLTEALLLAD
jgi:hypothetical protein